VVGFDFERVFGFIFACELKIQTYAQSTKKNEGIKQTESHCFKAFPLRKIIPKPLEQA
jgi:hypothetical protein